MLRGPVSESVIDSFRLEIAIASPSFASLLGHLYIGLVASLTFLWQVGDWGGVANGLVGPHENQLIEPPRGKTVISTT